MAEIISQAAAQQKEAAAKRAARDASKSATQTAAARLEQAKGELDALKQFQPQTAASSLSVQELETQVTSLESELTQAKEALAKSESSVAETTKRRAEIESELPGLEKQLLDRQTQIQAAQKNPDNSLAGEAARHELLLCCLFLSACDSICVAAFRPLVSRRPTRATRSFYRRLNRFF